jgi:hypothetical protein
MIKLKTLLMESPDTINYEGELYSYKDPENVCSFVLYNDPVDKGVKLFGYSIIKKTFFGDEQLVKTIKDIYSNQPKNVNEEKIKDVMSSLYRKNNGGPHLTLRVILNTVYNKRAVDESLTCRIFLVEKQPLFSAWNDKSEVKKYKNIIDYTIQFNDFKPEEVLYEKRDEGNKDIGYGDYKFITYYEMFDLPIPDSIKNSNSKNTSLPTSEIQELIDEKVREFIAKRSMLHTTGASMSSQQKKQLEIEVDTLEEEIKFLKIAEKLNKSQNLNLKKDNIYVLNGLRKAVQIVLDKKDDNEKYNLNTELEKQFPGKSIAQIRRDIEDLNVVNLRKVIKEMLLKCLKFKSIIH